MGPHVPDRAVLITCAEPRGVDYTYNVVLDARLTSSRTREVARLHAQPSQDAKQ
jgi:hypothetical protein